jgi:hypothetical protein
MRTRKPRQYAASRLSVHCRHAGRVRNKGTNSQVESAQFASNNESAIIFDYLVPIEATRPRFPKLQGTAPGMKLRYRGCGRIDQPVYRRSGATPPDKPVGRRPDRTVAREQS